MKRHPAALAWDAYKAANPNALDVSTLTPGPYLENRIRSAYEAGWFDAVQAMNDATQQARETKETT